MEESEHISSNGRRCIEVIKSEAEKMGRLIDDLLRLSRLGRQPLEKLSIDMTEMAQEVFDQLSSQRGAQAIDFRISPLPAAMGDAGLIQQVWLNLIDNAIKFTSHKEEPCIEITGGKRNDEYWYAVRDNGAGFSMQYVDKLFGVFQRLHTASEFDGTGVGLALVQRIVHKHGGSVSATGVVDHGATFEFTLPVDSNP
jgi:light-regulated signal transduction histidine kinase (bacteriophytochrome)